jgi:hypothetical protein
VWSPGEFGLLCLTTKPGTESPASSGFSRIALWNWLNSHGRRQEEEANLVSDLQLDLQHPPRIWGEVTGGAEGIRAIGLLVLTTPMCELIAHGAEQGFFAKTGCTTRTALPIVQVLQSTQNKSSY